MSKIGLIGLGTMGAMLSLNIAEHGFSIAVYNRTGAKTRAFFDNAGPLAPQITPTGSLEEFVAALEVPRKIILMVPAGAPVDEQIAALKPLLSPEDLIIDAGNANFHETNRRSEEAEGYQFMGIGVSGGEEGARFGPAIMGGGPEAAWKRVAPILEAIAAKYGETPCAAWFGPAGAGHFVKTVHNGIEYADMQLIAEVYGMMRDGMGMRAADCAPVFERWNEGPLESYLIDISARVAAASDPDTQKPMLDIILDRAGQKGTGRWTAIEAQQLGTPIPVIEAAVAARNMSAMLDDRRKGEAIFGAGPQALPADALTLEDLEAALTAGKIMCYAQGFTLLARAGAEYGWDIPLDTVAQTWRAGCIIRSSMLNDMAQALSDHPNQSLLYSPGFSERIKSTEPALRKVTLTAIQNGIAVPALSGALAWFDTMRTARGPANMLQGQRDFFGAHGFERTDRDGGDYHGPWARFWE